MTILPAPMDGRGATASLPGGRAGMAAEGKGFDHGGAGQGRSAAAYLREATLATLLRSSGFLSFLKGGAKAMGTSSSASSASSWATIVFETDQALLSVGTLQPSRVTSGLARSQNQQSDADYHERRYIAG